MHTAEARAVSGGSVAWIADRKTNEVSALALSDAVARFESLETPAARRMPHELLHRCVQASVREMCNRAAECERAGMPREAIVRLMEGARSIHARSPFVRRLQEWPRGYAGDFETIEYICNARNLAPRDSIAFFCETDSLALPIAQQHRNKVERQAAMIRETMAARPGASRILALACGSGRDFTAVLPEIAGLAGDIYLNDGDEDALAFTAGVLSSLRPHLRLHHGNALKVARRLAGDAPFDLVLAGGLFDYLPDRAATYLISTVWERLLGSGGRFFFTNIIRPNPYRVLIEYLGDWFLIERSEADMVRLCEEAGVPRAAIQLSRDSSGLAVLVEVVRP